MNTDFPGILFVDPHPATRTALNQLLNDEPWNCRFVATTKEALATLKTATIDLIVAEVSLGDTDGIQLFQKIQHDYPQIIRIFMTAGSDQDEVISALTHGQAQQLIPKPWIDQECKEILRSALRQSKQQKKHSLEFQRLINSIPLLPALPASYANVRSCIQQDDVDIDQMAEYISQDVALAAIVLRWANSALFGQRFQVDSIKKAIIVLGTDIVESLVLTEAVNRTVAGKIPLIKGFDFKKFQKHSMATASISRLLIKTLFPVDSVRQDRAFIAGLLHDLGKLVAASFYSQQFARAIELARKKALPLSEAEREIYQSDHTELGSFLTGWWALPPFIFNAIKFHHNPKRTPLDPDIIIAAYTANLLSYQFGYGSNGDTLPRELPENYRKQFFLTDEFIEILRAGTDKVICSLLN